jgi:sugar O-acyltransferase (sialic acid O-acetyltransferase NeuD family)
MTHSVVIFGIGNFARTASMYLTHDSPYNVAAFTAHAQFIREPQLLGRPVVPFESLEREFPPEKYAMLVAVGYNRVNQMRAEICAACKRKGYRLISYVHSKASRCGPVEIGENCFILENAVLQPFVRIGDDVVLWSGSIVCHDSTIGDHCFVAARVTVSGSVKVGPYCFLGAGATIRDGLRIAPGCVIGAGAVVVKDPRVQGVYLGTPASLTHLAVEPLQTL